MFCNDSRRIKVCQFLLREFVTRFTHSSYFRRCARTRSFKRTNSKTLGIQFSVYYNIVQSCKPETDGNNTLSQVQSGCRIPFISNDELVSNYADKCLSSLLALIYLRETWTNIPKVLGAPHIILPNTIYHLQKERFTLIKNFFLKSKKKFKASL